VKVEAIAPAFENPDASGFAASSTPMLAATSGCAARINDASGDSLHRAAGGCRWAGRRESS
jgi:hypothetical protein